MLLPLIREVLVSRLIQRVPQPTAEDDPACWVQDRGRELWPVCARNAHL